MELKLGANIAALRRAKGMTQEQLAAALGISPPAVSKLETNTSYPDITLLCPLARALDTNVDMLLNYEKTLPDEEVVQKINDLLALARTTGWQAAESALKNLLHQYPTSVSLKFHGAGLYAAFQVICPDAGTEERAAWDRQRKELFQAVHASGSTEYWQSAAIALAVMALSENALDEAEKLLLELPRLSSDPTVIWMELFLRRGEREQAAETLQKHLLHQAQQMQSCMVCLLDERLGFPVEVSTKINEALRQFESMLFCHTQLSDIMQVELFRRTGQTQKLIENLCRCLDGLSVPVQPPNEALFPALPIQDTHHEADQRLRQIIYLSIQQACQSEEYKNDPNLRAAMKRLEDIFST